MSLPSIEFLKAQANRLIGYMGDKHRFRLKPASSLEALAAMYGYSDWNTLHAMAARESEPAVASTSKQPAHSTFPLTWNRLGHADLSVDVTDWYRHTLGLGGSKRDRQAWLQQQLMAQLDRKSPGVFLNVFGAEMPGELRSAFRQEEILVDLRDSEKTSSQGLALNLLADLEPDSMASLLVAVLMPSGAPGHDFYGQQAHYMLTVVLGAMQEANLPVSLKSLQSMFPNGRPEGLYGLVEQLTAGSNARESLMVFLNGCGFDGESVQDRAWGTNYTVLMRALERLAHSHWAPMLFSADPAAQGLFSQLTEGKCLVIEGPEESDGQAEKAVLYALRGTLARRLRFGRKDTEQGWVFGLSEIDTYLESPLARMVELSRGSRIALLMTTRDTGALHLNHAGKSVLDNVWNQLYVNGCGRAQLLELLEQMANRPVLRQPGRITASVGY